jgi:homoserine O-acetyltransferase
VVIILAVMRTRCFAIALALLAWAGLHAADYPPPVEGDFLLEDFRFASGEVLPELKLHYRTVGKPETDAAGKFETRC